MRAIYAFGLLILIAFLGARFITKRKVLSPINYFLTVSRTKRIQHPQSFGIDGLDAADQPRLGMGGVLVWIPVGSKVFASFPQKI